VKLISQEEMETIRKTSNQSQLVTGRKTSSNDNDEENTNQVFQLQADKGKHSFASKFNENDR
jgi:hypothetical protein